MTPDSPCIAFAGQRRIAAGPLAQVALAVKTLTDGGAQGQVLIFDDTTGEQIDIDLRGTPKEVVARLAAPADTTASSEPASARGPGRPKLGVVAREVTLLPRHWDWLSRQPGGASVALRKLIDDARRLNAGKDRVRQSQEAAYRFMSAMAGNLPGFEEAARALFANDAERFTQECAPWPADIRKHAKRLAEAALAATNEKIA